jgi:hypothetical protein
MDKLDKTKNSLIICNALAKFEVKAEPSGRNDILVDGQKVRSVRLVHLSLLDLWSCIQVFRKQSLASWHNAHQCRYECFGKVFECEQS